MPSSIKAADELPKIAIASDEKVRRHLRTFDRFEVRVRAPIQLVGEELLNLISTKLTWRKANGVQNKQIDPGTLRSWTEVGRCHVRCKAVPTPQPKRVKCVGVRVVHRERQRLEVHRCEDVQFGSGFDAN